MRAFSPNGDGSEDSLRIRWTNAVRMDSLTLRVFRPDGKLVGSRGIPDTGNGAQAWDWNGVVGGSRVRPGRYVLQLVGVAGGRTFSAPSRRPATLAQVGAFGVTVDTTAPVVKSASASSTLVSPNGDGTRDTVRLSMTSTGATRWALLIASPAGTIRTASGSGGSIGFTWRGYRNDGRRAPDGRYTATLGVIDAAGNKARRSFTLTVDTTAPVISTAAAPAAFSPNGDGDRDTTRLSWSANERATGVVKVLHGSTLVRSWTVRSASSGAVAWDGRNASGKRVGDGRYTLRVELTDAAGNRRVATRAVVVDRTAGFLRWSRSFYPQDGDALAPTSTLSWRLARDARTTLRLYDASGALVRTVWTRKAQHAGVRTWAWNGRLANGGLAAAGPVRGAADGHVVARHARSSCGRSGRARSRPRHRPRGSGRARRCG